MSAMNNQIKSSYRWVLWLGLTMIAVAALIALFMSRTTTNQGRVTVTMDTKGTARLGGVPLLTTNIRDRTFTAMGELGIKAEMAIPAPLTNSAQESNVIETLKSMGRAGLFATNQPRPNPYE